MLSTNRSIRIGADIHQFVARVTKTIVSELVQDLSNATPIRTGFARTNWIVSLGRPFEGTAGTPEEALAGQLSELSFSQLRTFNAAFTPGTTAYITNNVSYIRDLNAGNSKQAPANFVPRVIEMTLLSVGRSIGRGNT